MRHEAPLALDDIRIADERDAALDHTAAINALARAAFRGHAGAMTRLGKRLLVGDRAPLRPEDGAGLLIQAMQAGDVEAQARVSVLLATGLYVKQSWGDALDLLARAAEADWEPAQSQLRALAPEAPAGASWMQRAQSIQPASWLGAPAAKIVHSDPDVRAFDAMIPPAVCAWLIESARPKLARARVYESSSGRDLEHRTRSNSAAIFNLIEVELTHLLVQARMAAACGLPLQNMEAPSVLHYRAGEEFDDHFDFIEPVTPEHRSDVQRYGQRVVTFLVYLNEDYEGGETDFPQLGVRHKGRRTEGLYFVNTRGDGEPERRMLHAGRAPARGEKWVVSQFVRGRPFMGAAANNR